MSRVLSVSVTKAGRAMAARLPYEHAHGSAAETVRARWGEADGFVLFLAVGAAVRIVGPLLENKTRDPAVVCVEESGRWVVPVCGGHEGGANALAGEVAALLGGGATAVVTTATDAVGLTALDALGGFAVEGDVAAVQRALLDGEPLRVENPLGWPLPTWLRHEPAAPNVVLISDAAPTRNGPGLAVLRPASLVVGVGASTAATPDELIDAVSVTLGALRLSLLSVGEVATVDRRAADPAVQALGALLGLSVRAYTPAELAGVPVPNPSRVVEKSVGTPSVAEAAALLAAGPGGELVGPKRRAASVTVAVARRRRPRGHLWLVGLGPGAPGLRTPAASAAVRNAEVVIGYRAYVEQAADAIPAGATVLPSEIGDEAVRAKQALAEAAAGRRVALVSSGDAGVYAMAPLVYELAPSEPALDAARDIEVVPGVSAAPAAAALLGAPLGHDHVAISLSDLHTPWEVIARRLNAAGAADLVVALYNPRSAGRTWQLPAALEILRRYRPASAPVGVVTDAFRPGQRVVVTSLGTLDMAEVGMTTIVIVGASTTTVAGGRMYTPRGHTP